MTIALITAAVVLLPMAIAFAVKNMADLAIEEFGGEDQ